MEGNMEWLGAQLGSEDDAGNWLRGPCWVSGNGDNKARGLPIFLWVGRIKKETWMVKTWPRIKYHFLV